MNTAAATLRPRPLVAALWFIGIAAGLLITGAGLVVSIAAVCTSYRHSSWVTKAMILALGILTVLMQILPVLAGSSGHS